MGMGTKDETENSRTSPHIDPASPPVATQSPNSWRGMRYVQPVQPLC